MIRMTGIVVLAVVAGAAVGGVETQTIDINFDSASGGFGTQVSFNQFDTQGGTRVLEGVDVRFEADMTLEATAQSFTETFIASGEWSADVFHNVLLSFSGDDKGDGEEGGIGAPFYGLGGIAITNLTGDLTPGDPGNFPFDPGTPGDPVIASTADSISSIVGTDAAFFGYFTGTGIVEGFTGPFVDITLSPPPGAFIDVFASELTQVGTLSLDYRFSVVPAPGAAALLAMGGLAAARRRR
jgi:hypothetical protein